MGKRVFLSYSRKDRAIMDSIAGDLRAMGHEVWFDDVLTGGQAWWNAVLTQISTCEVFLVVVTPHAADSQACMREAGYANSCRRPIMPVEGAHVVPGMLPRFLADLQFVDYDANDKNTTLRLLNAISTLPEGGPLPDPIPVPPEVPLSYFHEEKEKIDADAPLGLQEQRDLVFTLSARAKNDDDREAATDLLRRLRARPDVMAAVVGEIDHAFETLRTPGTGTELPAPAPASTPADRPGLIPRIQAAFTTAPFARELAQAEKQASQAMLWSVLGLLCALPAIAGLVLGYQAQKSVKALRGAPELSDPSNSARAQKAEGRGKAAVIVAWVILGLYVALLVLGAALGSSNQQSY